MAIKTSTFSGWRLSGKDAEAFLKQIKDKKPNSAASAAVKDGRNLAAEYRNKGYVILSQTKLQHNI